MRWEGIQVSAVAAALGTIEDTAAAVAGGRYDARERESSGYLGVRVCAEGPAVDLAVSAAELALKRCAIAREDVELVVHASMGFQGLDNFAPAPYVQRRTVGGQASALEVRQASNGGLAALDLAAAYLAVRSAPTSVLVTTGDRFAAPMFDRYRTSEGLLLGDGGTAVVLTRAPGVARLCSSAFVGVTTHEGLQRGTEPWADAPGGNGWPVAGDARVRRYFSATGASPEDLVHGFWRAENETMERALADAGITAADVAWWVFPNMGLTLAGWASREAFGVDLARTTWQWGRRQGHLGASDQIAGLAYLLESGRVRAGDHVLCHGAGAGFTFASMVFEITGEPEWSNTTD